MVICNSLLFFCEQQLQQVAASAGIQPTGFAAMPGMAQGECPSSTLMIANFKVDINGVATFRKVRNFMCTFGKESSKCETVMYSVGTRS